MLTQTIVFQFENQEQRKAVLDQFWHMVQSDDFPRITGLSLDDELRRSQLMLDALERYDDHYDLRDAVQAIGEASDLHKWSWHDFENETV